MDEPNPRWKVGNAGMLTVTSIPVVLPRPMADALHRIFREYPHAYGYATGTRPDLDRQGVMDLLWRLARAEARLEEYDRGSDGRRDDGGEG